MIKDILKIFLLSLFFSVVIFFINYNFFSKKDLENKIAEEKFIDNQLFLKDYKNLKPKETKKIKEFFKDQVNEKISFNYYPYSFKEKTKIFRNELNIIFNSRIFENKISYLYLDLFEKKEDRRGQMAKKHIKLYWYTKNKDNEYLAVFIHEFAHYIDIYFFQKQVFVDISDKFYKISWNSTKVKKKGQKISDFVSGYAMTNKYEDFAETFTYYVLHNKDFLEKTKKSHFLKQKYDFFSDYLFKNKEFFAKDFSVEKAKDYYWDITKIPFNKKKFLESIN